MGKRNTNSWEGQRPRCPQPPKSSYLKNSTITSVNFHSSKSSSPEVHTWMIARSLDPFGNAWKETLGHWSARFPSSAQNDAEC